jgi:hypothetical protein
MSARLSAVDGLDDTLGEVARGVGLHAAVDLQAHRRGEKTIVVSHGTVTSSISERMIRSAAAVAARCSRSSATRSP